jgi:hypothetical protein
METYSYGTNSHTAPLLLYHMATGVSNRLFVAVCASLYISLMGPFEAAIWRHSSVITKMRRRRSEFRDADKSATASLSPTSYADSRVEYVNAESSCAAP